MNEIKFDIPGGLLVAFEGIDGSGKTSMAKASAQHFISKGYLAKFLREPTDGEHGRRLREIMTSNEPRDAKLEFDLFIKDRQEDVMLNIQPVLQAGGIVCIDRYYISSMAYQGALGLDPQFIRAENEKFAPAPDLILYYDVSVDTALERIRGSRPAGANQFEQRENLEKVYGLFKSFDFHQMLCIDANQEFSAVKSDTFTAIDNQLRIKITDAANRQP